MEYAKLFETSSEYQAYIADIPMDKLPNVSYCVETNDVYMKELPHDYSQDYLTFRATQSGTFKLSGNSVSYSLDSGSTWTTLASNTNSPTVSSGDTIMFKGNLTPNSTIGVGRFSSSANFEAEGNPMSLLYGDNFREQYSLSDKNYAFYRLFRGCTKLTSAENLSLPATTLANYCYDGMFSGCTSLTTAPVLSATTLATSCYSSMFNGCTNLTTAPVLSATTLATSCYSSMFNGCTNLTTAPQLPATTLANNCYYGMFNGCTNLTTAPVLSATTLAVDCYSSMFYGCTSLTTAPQLPATTLANNCYYGMFNGCTNLNYIKAMFTTTPSSTYTSNWVNGVAANGTFVKNSAATWNVSGVNGVPNGWTIETASS